jgi:hypothetical protein
VTVIRVRLIPAFSAQRGLWGVVFALLYDWILGGMAWLNGLIFGLFIV